MVLEMLALPSAGLESARAALCGGPGFCFLRQDGHLTSPSYEYGITFISATYIMQHWSKYFHIETIALGGIHDFQDIVLMRRRAN